MSFTHVDQIPTVGLMRFLLVNDSINDEADQSKRRLIDVE